MDCQRPHFSLSNPIVTGEKKGQRSLWVKDKSMQETQSMKVAECVLRAQAEAPGFYLSGHCSVRPSKLSDSSI